ncbi:disintegrin and metalloproteinase domain-containing protein 10-like [Vespula squamosa]|uniref:Disintegrin and metalloproteinase domain-containing protein 10-like n=1 Tax=Vespula squamosa TaxID=30214 RepID=A0ABD2AKW1_VESSQ
MPTITLGNQEQSLFSTVAHIAIVALQTGDNAFGPPAELVVEVMKVVVVVVVVVMVMVVVVLLASGMSPSPAPPAARWKSRYAYAGFAYEDWPSLVIAATIVVLLLSSSFPLLTNITRDSYIRHYSPAWYDTAALREHRARSRRDTSASGRPKDATLNLRLRALDRFVKRHGPRHVILLIEIDK